MGGSVWTLREVEGRGLRSEDVEVAMMSTQSSLSKSASSSSVQAVP